MRNNLIIKEDNSNYWIIVTELNTKQTKANSGGELDYRV
jgi:hypothetical protein